MDIIKKKLSAKTSVGWDGLSTKVLKQISHLVCHPLSCIINKSFLEGKFPENLKLSLITPLHKKNERDDPANYRPISITSPISKVLEKAFLARLEAHLDTCSCYTSIVRKQKILKRLILKLMGKILLQLRWANFLGLHLIAKHIVMKSKVNNGARRIAFRCFGLR